MDSRKPDHIVDANKKVQSEPCHLCDGSGVIPADDGEGLQSCKCCKGAGLKPSFTEATSEPQPLPPGGPYFIPAEGVPMTEDDLAALAQAALAAYIADSDERGDGETMPVPVPKHQARAINKALQLYFESQDKTADGAMSPGEVEEAIKEAVIARVQKYRDALLREKAGLPTEEPTSADAAEGK